MTSKRQLKVFLFFFLYLQSVYSSTVCFLFTYRITETTSDEDGQAMTIQITEVESVTDLRVYNKLLC